MQRDVIVVKWKLCLTLKDVCVCEEKWTVCQLFQTANLLDNIFHGITIAVCLLCYVC